MDTRTVIRVIGIILICVGIYYGPTSLLPVVVMGAGLGFLFLP